jgi:membrane-bound metal-dependent hydrolase YbcI (DUF457 family)
MAMFRHHISLGAVLAMIGTVTVFFYGMITDPTHLGVLFALCAFSSILPDFDIDTGIPFYLIFGTMSVACTGVVLYYTIAGHPTNVYVLIGVPFATLLICWFVVGTIVKHCTHHRGIWHSMPMLLVVSLGTYVASVYLNQVKETAALYAAAMAVGYLSHLWLDELWSNVDADGNPFTYKRSLGTAMKFFSDSRKVNVFTYALLAILVYFAAQSSPVPHVTWPQ